MFVVIEKKNLKFYLQFDRQILKFWPPPSFNFFNILFLQCVNFCRPAHFCNGPFHICMAVKQVI